MANKYVEPRMSVCDVWMRVNIHELCNTHSQSHLLQHTYALVLNICTLSNTGTGSGNKTVATVAPSGVQMTSAAAAAMHASPTVHLHRATFSSLHLLNSTFYSVIISE